MVPPAEETPAGRTSITAFARKKRARAREHRNRKSLAARRTFRTSRPANPNHSVRNRATAGVRATAPTKGNICPYRPAVRGRSSSPHRQKRATKTAAENRLSAPSFGERSVRVPGPGSGGRLFRDPFFVSLIGLDDLLHHRVPDHIDLGEPAEPDPLHTLEDGKGLVQAGESSL